MGVRANLVVNGNRSKRAVVVLDVPLSLEQLRKVARNKFRLKASRFFAEGGRELEDGDLDLRQDQVVLCSAGEAYDGAVTVSAAAPTPAADAEVPATGAAAAAARTDGDGDGASLAQSVPPLLRGFNDAGASYGSVEELWSSLRRDEWYDTNRDFWVEGMNGRSNDEAMIGDESSETDLESSRRFLERLLDDGLLPRSLRRSAATGAARKALDVGAGAGRVTRGLLLRFADEVHLVDGNEHWLQQARRTLGKKRALQCHFSQLQLQDAGQGVPWEDEAYGLVWVQLVLQYLTDDDAVTLLQRCRSALAPAGGVVVVRENHAEGLLRRRSAEGLPTPEDVASSGGSLFFVETPDGANGCFDVTRPDAHHRWLFRRAGLAVAAETLEEELVTYALRPA